MCPFRAPVVLAAAAALLSLVGAATLTATPTVTQTPTPSRAFAAYVPFPANGTCAGGAATRPCTYMEPGSVGAGGACWCPGAGPWRRFTLRVGSTTVTPPGTPVPKALLTVNGSTPGPPLVVDEGDWVVVDVVNDLDASETTVHWHGQLQVLTPYADGVPGVTQCAIPPGGRLTYAVRASVAGTYWYHGHMLEQYVDGLIGAVIIRPPPGAPQPPRYDDDITLLIQDVYRPDAHALLATYYLTPLSAGAEPVPDYIAVNGLYSAGLFGQAPNVSAVPCLSAAAAAATAAATMPPAAAAQPAAQLR